MIIRQNVSLEDDGMRLDSFLAASDPDRSRSFFKKLIDEGLVLVNGERKKASYLCSVDDEVAYEELKPQLPEIKPVDIPLSILFEDDDILVVDKPKGMVVHPAPGHIDDTLVNAVMFHCWDSLSGINGEQRPGIVHRIDRDTTGSLVVCKNDSAHNFIAEQIAAHTMTRRYRGIVIGGGLDDTGTVSGPIGRDPRDRKRMAINEKNGKPAVTHYKMLCSKDGYSYMEFELETGRTHQIRVHLASIGHPLLGDEVYGPKKCPFRLQGQTLHAMTLGFIHPSTKEYVEFSAPLPDYFEKLLERLGLSGIN